MAKKGQDDDDTAPSTDASASQNFRLSPVKQAREKARVKASALRVPAMDEDDFACDSFDEADMDAFAPPQDSSESFEGGGGGASRRGSTGHIEDETSNGAEDDGGFSVVSSSAEPFRRSSLSHETSAHARIGGGITERSNRTTGGEFKGHRRGSCSMLSKPRSQKQREMDDEEMFATLVSEECELEEQEAKAKKKKKKKDPSSSKSKKKKSSSSDDASETSNRKSSSSKKSSKKERSSSEKTVKEDEEEDAESNDGSLDPEQAKYLEQRRKERAARVEMAKERIRRKKEAEGRKESMQKAEQDEEEKLKQDRPLTKEERLKKAYQWYMRCGMPDQQKFKERVRRMQGTFDITEEDVDLLPWIAGGRRVNIKSILTAQ